MWMLVHAQCRSIIQTKLDMPFGSHSECSYIRKSAYCDDTKPPGDLSISGTRRASSCKQSQLSGNFLAPKSRSPYGFAFGYARV
eukprot:6186037-Pleurochrysis_carterae.AAC.4